MPITPARFFSCLIFISTLLSLHVQAANNVLLIIADDLGAEVSPGYIGADKPSMPNVNALVRSGVRFTNVWVQPYCSPTRACILTGRYGYTTGVLYPGDVLDPAHPSIPDQLPAEVKTAVFGKWHLDGNSPSTKEADHVIAMGFDKYVGSPGAAVRDYFSWTKYQAATDVPATSAPSTTYATSDTSAEALDWIKSQGQSTPWLAWVAFNAGHTPLHKPPVALLNTTTSKNLNAATATSRQKFKAMCEALDTEIGKLINGLDAATRASTTIIFIGDNGTHSANKVGGFRYAKGSVYEGGLRVPLIVSGRTVSGANRCVSQLVNGTDLYRTITDLFDVAPSSVTGGEDSNSILPYLQNQPHPNPRNAIYADLDTPSTPLQQAIRDVRYKLIRRAPNNVEEYYDLQNDAQETKNLIGQTLPYYARITLTALRNQLNLDVPKQAKTLKSIGVISAGSGYTVAPSLVISGGGGSGAAAFAKVSDGRITEVTITQGGSGYTSAPNVMVVGGGGIGAVLVSSLE